MNVIAEAIKDGVHLVDQSRGRGVGQVGRRKALHKVRKLSRQVTQYLDDLKPRVFVRPSRQREQTCFHDLQLPGGFVLNTRQPVEASICQPG